MAEQRNTEIMVVTATQDWSEEMVAQWNVLADTVGRTVQQRTKHIKENGPQDWTATREQEFQQMRAALAGSEERMAAAAQEAADRLDATQRYYKLKLTLLEEELARRGAVSERKDTPPEIPLAAAALPVEEIRAANWSSSEPEEEPLQEQWQPSALDRTEEALRMQWARLRSSSLLPVAGFLAGLLVMVSLYPFVRHTPVRAANTTPLAKSPMTDKPAAGARQGLASTNSASTALEAKSPSINADGAKNTAVSPIPPESPAALNEYAVLLAGGKTLTADHKGAPSVAYEAQLAMHAGYATTALYQRDGRYMAAVVFNGEQQARDGIQLINGPYDGRWKRTSSVVAISEWCPNKKALDPVVINGADVAVWSCSKGPS